MGLIILIAEEEDILAKTIAGKLNNYSTQHLIDIETSCEIDFRRIPEFVNRYQPHIIFLDTLWQGNLLGPRIYDLLKAHFINDDYDPIIFGMSALLEYKIEWKKRGVPFLLKPNDLEPEVLGRHLDEALAFKPQTY